MATLLLTAVGAAFGGRIGSAIGAIAGQAIDRELFKGKGREGPRLTELSVQTSSYGSPIPAIFGTMRVAGTVIWSTDLIESTSKTSNGKGQPSTTNYSYSASFAVALSGRPIKRVGRIWADGNLLRGSGGDFKTATGFRLHTGGEDQPVDPLIAAAEGALAPAHRGLAYAVFEHLQLADFGNRIPSLTFEVFADEGPVAIGTIAEAIGAGLVSADRATTVLAGFSAYGDSARGTLGALIEVGGYWLAPTGGTLTLRGDGLPERAIADEGAGAGQRGARAVRQIAAIETVPQLITLAHYDPARDYQTGVQRARRPGPGERSIRIEVAAAIDAGPAKAMAEAKLRRAEAGRETRRIAHGWSALDLAPGAVVSIAGEAGRWRVTGWSLEAMVLTLDLVRLGSAVAGSPASSGRVLASPDVAAGPTIIHAFELPALDDTLLSSPRVLVAAAGTGAGWRRAALLYSTDNGGRWTPAGSTALPAVIGTVAAPPRAAGSALRDLVSSVEVELARTDMVLADADDAALDSGANLALVGDELLQFGEAVPIGPARWRLSRLLRGRRGTEFAAGAQQVGDRFVLIEREALVAIDLPVTAIGRQIAVMASGVGDSEGPARVDMVVTGASVLPASPVHLRIDHDAGMLRWARRSRTGWRWIDGSDVPLSEESEAYRIDFANGASVETQAPALAIADGAALPVTVRQRGTQGLSRAATLG
ncbi:MULTISPECIES: phage tail protein [Sphingomonas]|uniref:phage tail protein n=1 Tax=Sphingomonas TaxID=13687 RepID=UPI0008345B10|nr:phage tail protein [Sphingomonas sp. CCH10-B3]